MVGVSGYTVRPPEARKKPRVSAFINANFDKIEALRPDLIFAFSDLQADIAAELVRRGYPVFTFNQRSVDEILQMILVVGGIVGRADRAQKLVDELRSGLDAIRGHGRDVAPPATRLLRRVGRPADLGNSGGSRSLPRLPAARPSSRNWPARGLPRTASSIPPRSMRRDPEVIVASWCGKAVKPARITSRPGWDAISAVRHGHVYEIKSVYILQPGPAALTEGVRRLHECIGQGWCRSGILPACRTASSRDTSMAAR